MRILGIDPGLASCGWGVIEVSGVNKIKLISFGVIKTLAHTDLSLRVETIANDVSKLIDTYFVDSVSIEDIFFTKNISSAINVAKVIGSIIYVGKNKNCDVKLFTPLQAKIAITGYGNADKNQMQEMVKLLLKLDKIPRPDHSADALGLAITYNHIIQTKNRGVR